jgi:hypothetical protein
MNDEGGLMADEESFIVRPSRSVADESRWVGEPRLWVADETHWVGDPDTPDGR